MITGCSGIPDVERVMKLRSCGIRERFALNLWGSVSLMCCFATCMAYGVSFSTM